MPGNFDPRTPNIPRVYNSLAGGKDNYEADRSVADKMIALSPDVARLAPENRAFAGLAARWLAEQGIEQFLDLGCGMPLSPNIHDTAREVNPDARVAYIDIDTVAVNHMSVYARAAGGVVAAQADAADIAAVRAAVAEVIDFTQPVGLIAGGLLHFWEPADARKIFTSWSAAVAPGSYFAFSLIGSEGRVAAEFLRLYSVGVAPVWGYSAADAARLVEGYELVSPGIGVLSGWRPGWTETAPGTLRDIWGHVGIVRL